jgi:RNA-directed DNA polymerase
MQNALKSEIKRLAYRAFRRASKEKQKEQDHRKKFEKRTGVAAGVPAASQINHPHRHFDPKYCARNANFLAKTIWHKVLTESYEPVCAAEHLIPKPDGSKRSVMAFTIPDAALANVVLRRARDRNLKRMSPASYAYHPDKNVFDAVLALREFAHDGRLFAVQIDFEKYFDLIPTGYIEDRINDASQISLTPHEKQIFHRFLKHTYVEYDQYQLGKRFRRHRGTPQGSSVSLLLANLANHELDTALSYEAGKFVRFADDVVALCSKYEQAQLLENCFNRHCDNSGLKINLNKSPGIAIISQSPREMRTYTHFDYLGYRFTTEGLGIPEKVKRRIMSRISRLANIYLLQYLKFGFNKSRTAIQPHPYDWDLLGLIYELRNSLYGGLAEADLLNFVSGGDRLPKMKGLMGFYCLLDDPSTLREMDGCMLSLVRRASALRNQRINSIFGASCPTPSNRELATGSWLDLAAWKEGDLPDPRMPSFVRGWRAARKHYFTFGLEDVEAPKYSQYADIDSLFDY